MASENKLPGRVEFGKARLDAIGDLDDKSALKQQRKIAGSDVLLKVSIQDPKTSDALRSRLVYYYKEAASYYYQSNSNDIAKLQGEILPQVIELDEDIRNDAQLHDEFHKKPLLDILYETYKNIKIKTSFSNRIAAKAKRILNFPVGGIIAGAATKNPLIGLAVAAYEFSNKNKKKPTGSTVFHREQILNEKLLERAQLDTDEVSSPVSSEAITPTASRTSTSTGIDYSSDDAELKAYANGMQPGDMTPSQGYRNNGQAGSILNLSPVTAILNKHTNLLGGTYRNSKAIVNILQGNSLNEEESLGESKSSSKSSSTSISKSGSKSTIAGKAMDFVSKIKDVLIEIGPGIVAAIGAAIPTIAAALPALATAAVVAVGGTLGYAIGTAIQNYPPIRKILDWVTGVDSNNAKISADAAAMAEDAKARKLRSLSEFKRKHGIGSNADLKSHFAKEQTNTQMPKMGVIPDSVYNGFSGVKSGASTSPVAAPAPVPSAPSASRVDKTTSDFIIAKEGTSTTGKAYWDPPNKKESASVGYGHLITKNEIKQGYIDLGDERVAVVGNKGIDTMMTTSQAEKLKNLDLIGYQDRVIHGYGNKKGIGEKAWAKLNENQRAALTSYAYNVGNIGGLVNKGLTEAINNGDMQKAASLIKNGVSTVDNKPFPALITRRNDESQLYMASSSGDSTQPGRRELTTSVSRSPAATAPVMPMVFNTNNQNTSMVGGGGARSTGIPAPIDNSPTLRKHIGT